MMQLKRLGMSLLLFVTIFQFLLVSEVYANEIPKGVTIQEVKAVSNVKIGTYKIWRNGQALETTVPRQLGDIKVNCDYEYTLTFYNVGALGGEKYQKAVLTRRWVAQNPGEVWVSRNQVLKENYEKYLATNPKVVVPMPQVGADEIEMRANTGGTPHFNTEILSDTIVFSGGPTGVFKGIYGSSKDIMKLFYVAESGSSVWHVTGIDSGVMVIQNPGQVWKGWDPSDSGARFSGCTGQVEILVPGAEDWKLVKIDTVIPVGAHIRTQENSSAILSFADTSVFVLKEDSEVVVITPPEKESKFKLVAGQTWANFKRIVSEGSFEIEMNQAVCGIKGTTFVCEVKKDGTSSLKVIEGTVEFTAKADGKKVMVTEGNMVSADLKGLGTVGKFDTAKETALWEKVKASTSSTTGNQVSSEQKSPFSKLYIFGLVGVIIIAGLGFALFRKNRQNV